MYSLVYTSAELKDLTDKVSQANIVALDTETTNVLRPRDGKLRLIQLGFEDNSRYVIDCFKFSHDEIKAFLESFLPSTSIKKIIHNAVFEQSWFYHHYGLKINAFFDTLLAQKLLYFQESAKLGDVIEQWLKIKIDKSEQKSDWTAKVLTESQLDYAANDVTYLIPLREKMLEECVRLKLLDALKTEFDCVFATAKMQVNGIPADRERANEFIQVIETNRDKAYADLYKFLKSEDGKKAYKEAYTIDLFGNRVSVDDEETVNLRSNKQLLTALKACGIIVESTSSKILKTMVKEYPKLKYLLDFRKQEKLCSSFGREFFAEHLRDNGRIYPFFNQMGAVTGRFSSSSPNSQQQPNSKEYRRLFTPPKGRKFIVSDMAQFELRILASLSNDPVMIAAINGGQDLHSVTTSLIFGLTYEEACDPVNAKLRKQAKICNFGIAYGIGASGLSMNLRADGVEASEDDAQKLIDGWMQGYEKAGQWLNQQKGLVYKSIRKYQWKDGQQGRVYIRGFDGRLLMPTFIVGDKESEGGAKRDCKNFPIQSANAVSIKRCLPALDADLSRLYPTAMIVNCIHDEIVVEVDDDEKAQDICNLVQKHMEDAATFYIKNVDIKADAKVCNDWSEK